MDLAAQLNRLIEEGADEARLGAWLAANAEAVAEKLELGEDVVLIPEIDLSDMTRFIDERDAQRP